MYHLAVLALSLLIYEQAVFAATIDQRQNGDFNVQIDLKNLKIVGLMKGKEEYVDYDYAYDYSEMTIKPSSGTTKKPLSLTESPSDKDNTTAFTTVSTELDYTTSSSQNITLAADTTDATTQKTAINGSGPIIESEVFDVTTISAHNLTFMGTLHTTTQKIAPSDSSTIANDTTPIMLDSTSSNTTNSHCKKGFFLNSKGNCELKLQNPSNALLKMIKQKSKFGSNTPGSRL